MHVSFSVTYVFLRTLLQKTGILVKVHLTTNVPYYNIVILRIIYFCWRKKKHSNPLIPGDKKSSRILKQTCSWNLQVCLNCVTFLLPPGIKGLTGFENNTKHRYKENYLLLETATGVVLYKKLFLKTCQYSQESTCVGVYFLIKLQA